MRRHYDVLEAVNIPDGHLTGAIKCRGKDNDDYPTNLAFECRTQAMARARQLGLLA